MPKTEAVFTIAYLIGRYGLYIKDGIYACRNEAYNDQLEKAALEIGQNNFLYLVNDLAKNNFKNEFIEYSIM